MASYKFISINSNTIARRPVGASYRTSYSFMIYGWGLRRRNAYISLRLLISSIEVNWFFMHLMATCLLVFMLRALSTSENVPSPTLLIKTYLCILFIVYNYFILIFNFIIIILKLIIYPLFIIVM